MKLVIKKIFILLFFLSFIIEAKEIPFLSGPIVDEAHIFNSSQIGYISNILREFHERTKKQIQVLIISSLEGDSLEDFSMRVAEKWKIGNKKDGGSGVLLLISMEERKLRIEVGSGLEGELTDLISGKIIRTIIAPHFKSQNYAMGVIEGIKAISLTLKEEINFSNEELKIKTRRSRSNPVSTVIFFIIILIVFIFGAISNIFNRYKYGNNIYSKDNFRRRNNDIFFGGFGGGSSGGSSGGSWSGGGGGFSGGGASGGW